MGIATDAAHICPVCEHTDCIELAMLALGYFVVEEQGEDANDAFDSAVLHLLIKPEDHE